MLSRTYRRMSFYLTLKLIEKFTEFSNLNVSAQTLMQSGIKAVCKTRDFVLKSVFFEETDRSAVDRLRKNASRKGDRLKSA